MKLDSKKIFKKILGEMESEIREGFKSLSEAQWEEFGQKYKEIFMWLAAKKFEQEIEKLKSSLNSLLQETERTKDTAVLSEEAYFKLLKSDYDDATKIKIMKRREFFSEIKEHALDVADDVNLQDIEIEKFKRAILKDLDSQIDLFIQELKDKINK